VNGVGSLMIRLQDRTGENTFGLMVVQFLGIDGSMDYLHCVLYQYYIDSHGMTTHRPSHGHGGEFGFCISRYLWSFCLTVWNGRSPALELNVSAGRERRSDSNSSSGGGSNGKSDRSCGSGKSPCSVAEDNVGFDDISSGVPLKETRRVCPDLR
jgi:hypothetical protein